MACRTASPPSLQEAVGQLFDEVRLRCPNPFDPEGVRGVVSEQAGKLGLKPILEELEEKDSLGRPYDLYVDVHGEAHAITLQEAIDSSKLLRLAPRDGHYAVLVRKEGKKGVLSRIKHLFLAPDYEQVGVYLPQANLLIMAEEGLDDFRDALSKEHPYSKNAWEDFLSSCSIATFSLRKAVEEKRAAQKQLQDLAYRTAIALATCDGACPSIPYSLLLKAGVSPQTYLRMVGKELEEISPETAHELGRGGKAKALALALGAIIGFALLAGAALAYQQHVQRERLRRERIGHIMQVSGMSADDAEEFYKLFSPYVAEWRNPHVTNLNSTMQDLARMYVADKGATIALMELSGNNATQAVYSNSDQPVPDAFNNRDEVFMGRDPLFPELLPALAYVNYTVALAFDGEFGAHVKMPYPLNVVRLCMIYAKNATMARQLFSWANHSFTKAIEGDPDGDGIPTWEEFDKFGTNPLKWEPWNDLLWAVERLDTPEKALRFREIWFTYGKTSSYPYYLGPYYVHKERVGICGDLAVWLTFVLNYNGYEAYYVVFWNGSVPKHAVTLLHNETGYYVLDFISPDPKNQLYTRVYGPFLTIPSALSYAKGWSNRYEIYELGKDPYRVILRKVEEGEL